MAYNPGTYFPASYFPPDYFTGEEETPAQSSGTSYGFSRYWTPTDNFTVLDDDEEALILAALLAA
jgi:hypothetical protein